MRCFVMFVTADGVLFLLKLKWPKNKIMFSVFFHSEVLQYFKVNFSLNVTFDVRKNVQE